MEWVLDKPLSAQKAHNQGWKSSVAAQALDQLNAGVIVTDGCGEVVDINRTAEAIVRLRDGLLIQSYKLCTRRVFETKKLAKLVAGVTAAVKRAPAAGRMLVTRFDGLSPYVLTIAPLRTGMVLGQRLLALIVVVDPDQHSPSEKDLADFFGLSRAEARLAVSLLTGKSLADIAASTGVRITTLRTQLASIMRKTGTQRQSDLIRIFSSTGIGSLSCLVGWLDTALDALQIFPSLAGV